MSWKHILFGYSLSNHRESLNKIVETSQNILLITINVNGLEFLARRSSYVIIVKCPILCCLPKIFL